MFGKKISFRRAILAGFSATAVMTALMYGGPLFGLPRMDILAALGGVFPFGMSPYVIGSVIHLSMGISLGVLYALFFHPWLPGPGWLRGATFSLLPWVFAITLLGPSLQLAGELLKGKEAVAANPCSMANPCAARTVNPCSVNKAPSNPCAAKVSNPCAVSANPCAVANPCGGSAAPASGPSPQAMSLVMHLVFGGVLGAAYKPSGQQKRGEDSH